MEDGVRTGIDSSVGASIIRFQERGFTGNLNNMVIKYYTRTDQYSFGRERKYVVGDVAVSIAALTGRSTMTDGDVSALTALGHTLKEVKQVEEV